MGIALVIPISYQLDTATGIGLLLAVYCGAVCGASIPAILLGIPGNPNAIATTEDGLLMTKKGIGWPGSWRSRGGFYDRRTWL